MRTTRRHGRLAAARTAATVMATVAVTMAACGESLAPTSVERDLDFIAPTAAPVGVLRQELIASPYAAVASMPALVELSESLRPSISGHFLKGWFAGADFIFEYGLSGVGTSYSITPQLHIVDENGRTLRSGAGLGLSESFFVPFMMFPTGRERVNIGVQCGATATVSANFEIRVSIEIIGVIRFWSVQRNADDTSYQPACPPPPPPQGGGGSDDLDGTWLCFYDVWFDDYGRVVDWVEIGCYKMDGQAM